MFFVFFIHDGLRCNLYLSIAKKAIEKNINFRIYCFSLKEYFWFKNKGISKLNLKLVQQSKDDGIIDGLEKTIDVAAKFLTMGHASSIYHSTLQSLQDLNNIQADVFIFAGNGLHAFDKAIAEYLSLINI